MSNVYEFPVTLLNTKLSVRHIDKDIKIPYMDLFMTFDEDKNDTKMRHKATICGSGPLEGRDKGKIYFRDMLDATNPENKLTKEGIMKSPILPKVHMFEKIVDGEIVFEYNP